jgi:hypothetical protein
MADYQNNNPLVGFVNAPRVEIRVSFTEAELNDMKQYLTGKETKRVYLTIKTGEKKDKSGTYQIASVYDPNANGQGSQQSRAYAQSQGAPAPSQANPTQGGDLPF